LAGSQLAVVWIVMALEWEQTIVVATNPARLGEWWREALGWVVVGDDPETYEIRPAPDRMPAYSTTAQHGSTLVKVKAAGWCSPTPKAMSSAS
jgi:hypothetical protein